MTARTAKKHPMRTTATKSRASVKNTTRRAPAPGAVDGVENGVFFDGANTFYGSRCQADDGGRTSTVAVEIEIHPRGAEFWDNATVFFQFFRDAIGRDKKDLQLRSTELEPLAVALTRAVANAAARGFLPDPENGAAT